MVSRESDTIKGELEKLSLSISNVPHEIKAAVVAYNDKNAVLVKMLESLVSAQVDTIKILDKIADIKLLELRILHIKESIDRLARDVEKVDAMCHSIDSDVSEFQQVCAHQRGLLKRGMFSEPVVAGSAATHNPSKSVIERWVGSKILWIMGVLWTAIIGYITTRYSSP